LRGDYVAPSGYHIRATIRHARGDPGWREDSERSVEAARRIAEAQALAPTLAGHARLLALEGDRAAARALLEEVLDLYATLPASPQIASPPVVLAFATVGDPDEYRPLLDRAEGTEWIEPGRHVCDCDFQAAAEAFERIGVVAPAAELRVIAAARLAAEGDRAGSQAQLARAIAFYRSVGASRWIHDAEALLPASA
jgi:Flp pilus assembly protein TadD